MQSLLQIRGACCLGTWVHRTDSPRNKGQGAPEGEVAQLQPSWWWCAQCMVLPLFHLSSEIWCASGEAQARLKDLLCFRSRACSFMGWLGSLLQQLSSSSSSPCVTGSWALLPPQGAEEHGRGLSSPWDGWQNTAAWLHTPLIYP